MPRPRFRPTAEQRNMVERMAAIGLPEAQIAVLTGEHGIDPKTLRKHFRHELDVGAAKANSKIGQTLFQMGTSGQCPAATIFLAKCRLGFRETNILMHSGPDGGPVEFTQAGLGRKLIEEFTRLSELQEKREDVPGKSDRQEGTPGEPGPRAGEHDLASESPNSSRTEKRNE